MNKEILTNVDNSFLQNRIIYMDDYLAVYNKLPGEICESWEPSSKEAKDEYVPESFKNYISDAALHPKFCQCFNRLDRPVSGANLILFEKSLFPLLQNQFTNSQKNEKSVKKVYWAIIEGVHPKTEKFTLLDNFIRFDSIKQKSFVYKTEERKTKKASLLYRSIGHGDNYSFFEIELITGRTHQIRAQLAHIGLHIKGDVKYGARRQDTLNGIRLHAYQIEFNHPKSKKKIIAKAQLPTLDPLWEAFLECV